MAKQDERLDEFKENRLIKKKISYFIIKFKQTTGLMLMFALGSIKLILSNEDHQLSYTRKNFENRTFENANYFRK